VLIRLLVFASSLALAAPAPETLARSVTIYRDTYGVPHVYGPTDAACVFGYAYAQAEDNFLADRGQLLPRARPCLRSLREKNADR
jgi:acyl-homoserine lactone acylase PvdQ